MDILIELGKLLVALLVLGLSTERGIELLKVFWNMATAKWEWLSLRNRLTCIFAAAVAFFVVHFFGVDITQYISVLDGFDPELLKLVNALLLMLASNLAHEKLKAASLPA